MKTRHSPLSALTAAALVAGAALTAQAQNWVNVLDPALGGIAGSSGDYNSALRLV